MDKKTQTKLHAAGWQLGDAQDFLQLTEQELMLLQIKESLSQAVRTMKVLLGFSSRAAPVKPA